MNLVGRVHNCIPKSGVAGPKLPSAVMGVTVPKDTVPASSAKAVGGVGASHRKMSASRSEMAASTSTAKFDRKTYQRDYMRTYMPKWRARQRP